MRCHLLKKKKIKKCPGDQENIKGQCYVTIYKKITAITHKNNEYNKNDNDNNDNNYENNNRTMYTKLVKDMLLNKNSYELSKKRKN